MAFCLCQPFTCESEGLISVSINGSSSSRIIPGTTTVIPGAATGGVNLVGYAFSKGEDKWLGVRCPSSAKADQTNYVRFDCCSDRFVIIPSKINTAVLTGDSMNGVGFSQFNECGVIVGETASIKNGITIAQKTITRFGHNLKFKDFTFPDTSAKNVFGAQPCFIQSFTVSSNFPQVAQYTAGYQFMVSC